MYQGSDVNSNLYQPMINEPDMGQQPMMMQPGYQQPNIIAQQQVPDMVQPAMPVVAVIETDSSNCQHIGPTLDIGTMGSCSWLCCVFLPVIGLLACCCPACQDVSSTCTQCGRTVKYSKFRCGFGACCDTNPSTSV